MDKLNEEATFRAAEIGLRNESNDLLAPVIGQEKSISNTTISRLWQDRKFSLD